MPFHLGMHLTLDIGTFQASMYHCSAHTPVYLRPCLCGYFQLTMISALLLLLPGSACDRVEGALMAGWWRVGEHSAPSQLAVPPDSWVVVHAVVWCAGSRKRASSMLQWCVPPPDTSMHACRAQP